MEGSDGNLWEDYWNGSSWNWVNLSRPSGVNINASLGVSTYGNSTEVFVTGSDGNIWEDFYNGSSWGWTKLGTPNSTVGITAASGTGVVAGSETQVFTKAHRWQTSGKICYNGPARVCV